MDVIYAYIDILGVRLKAFIDKNDALKVKMSPNGGVIPVHFKTIHAVEPVKAEPVVEVVEVKEEVILPVVVTEPIDEEIKPIKKGGKRK